MRGMERWDLPDVFLGLVGVDYGVEVLSARFWGPARRARCGWWARLAAQGGDLTWGRLS